MTIDRVNNDRVSQVDRDNNPRLLLRKGLLVGSAHPTSLDYQPQWAELEASRNPFAIVVMAHLKTKETRKQPLERKEWKFRLTRLLYERGYERQDIINLFRFIDWILELPEDLKRSFRDELERYERENQMPYVTSIERMGIEQERQKIAIKMLRKNIPLETIAELTELTIEQLQFLRSQLETN